MCFLECNDREEVGQMLTRGGGGVKQMLTIADEGGRGGLKTSEIGWRNMWTAPNQFLSQPCWIGQNNLNLRPFHNVPLHWVLCNDHYMMIWQTMNAFKGPWEGRGLQTWLRRPLSDNRIVSISILSTVCVYMNIHLLLQSGGMIGYALTWNVRIVK